MTKEQKAKELISKIKFEGSYEDWVQWIGEGLEEFAALKAQLLVDTLQKVVDWQFPETGKFWDKDQMEPMSYAAVYGSNGERDYMRGIAKDALASYAGSAEGEKESSSLALDAAAQSKKTLARVLAKKGPETNFDFIINKAKEFAIEYYGTVKEEDIRGHFVFDKIVNGFVAGHYAAIREPEKKDPWIRVKDQPLGIDTKLGWECTKAGEGEFLAAIQLDDDHWWIRHCVIEDMIGLCVVGDDENTPAGYDAEDVQYYWPLPEPPAATNQEGV